MIGVDLSLHPWNWATSRDRQWVVGQLRDDQDPAVALRTALAQQGIRDRTVALCIPSRSVVWDTLPGFRLTQRRTRKAAVNGAVLRLKTAPHETVISLTQVADGVMYGCAERAVIETIMAPWIAGGLKVAAIEPAATVLLRGLGLDAPTIVVRAGDGELEIVAGSRNRLVLARHLPGPWEGHVNAVRLEVDATIDTARREGVATDRVVVTGHGNLDALLSAFSGRASLAQMAIEPNPPLGQSAVAALSVAVPRTGFKRPLMPLSDARDTVAHVFAAFAAWRAHGRIRSAA